VSIGARHRGEKRPAQGEEGVGGGAERGVMMEALPRAPFEVI